MSGTPQQEMKQESLPPRPNPWRLFWAYNSPGPRWPGATRAALAIFVPGFIALMLGFEHEMLLIAAGSCTVIYGEGHPYRARVRIMLTAAIILIFGASTGSMIGEVVWGHINSGSSRWWMLLTVLWSTSLAAVLAYAANALRLPPPGAFFFVMVASASTMTAKIGFDPLEVAMWTSIGALSAMVFGMLPMLVNPNGPEERAVGVLEKAVRSLEEGGTSVGKRHQAETALADAWFALSDARIVSGGKIINKSRTDLVERAVAAQYELVRLASGTGGPADSGAGDTPSFVDSTRTAIPHTRPTIAFRLYRSAHRHSHAAVTAAKITIASLLAGIVSLALGLDRPDWAVVSVFLTLQWGPGVIPGTVRGVHRLIGSVLGIGLFSLIYVFHPSPLILLIALTIAQFYAEIFVVKNYAIAVIFTTPLALLMGGATSIDLATVAMSRVGEVGVAFVFAIAVLWLYMPNSQLHEHRRMVERCYAAMGNLIGALTTKTPAEALGNRRDLQYELLGERLSIHAISADHPAEANAQQQHHLDLQSTGYQLLDYCTANADRELTMEEIADLSARVRVASEGTNFGR